MYSTGYPYLSIPHITGKLSISKELNTIWKFLILPMACTNEISGYCMVSTNKYNNNSLQNTEEHSGGVPSQRKRRLSKCRLIGIKIRT